MSREIPLSRGLFAIVDDEDYEALSKFKWHAAVRNKGLGHYARRSAIGKDGKSRTIRMHRQIMGFHLPMIDHENGNGLDNRRENLRSCPGNSENQVNQALRRNNTTGATGVVRHCGKYRAQIRIRQQFICLGVHPTLDEAALAYNKAAVRFFGDFARLNPVGTYPRSDL